MINRHILLAVAAVSALAPLVSGASTEKVSAKACANAFASSIAGSSTGAPTYKFAYRGGSASSVFDFYPTSYTFTLEAHDSKSGAAIARARCSADFRGVVTGIEAVPLDQRDATFAASF